VILLELSEYAKIYADGDAVFTEGDSGDRAFVVESGEVEIWCIRNSERVQLQLLQAGSIFGEMSVIDGSPRSANASACGEVKLMEVTSNQLRTRLQNTDPIIRMIVGVLLERFRNERRVHRGNGLFDDPKSFTRGISNFDSVQTSGDTAIDKIRLENELELAIERKEFSLRYQPIVDLETDEIRGFEALIRWNHPIRGFVSPLEFIELAEETKLIVPIGQWVVEQACKDLSELLKKPGTKRSLFMSVNFSGRQLMDRSFLAHLLQTSQEFKLSPGNINIEITEGVFLAEENLTSWLEECRDAGFKVVLDDFGTGYSSLSYLSKYPINKVKVDKSFVNDVAVDARARAIVSAVVGIAQAMDMQVVVEGVETKEQQVACTELGCRFGQGYLFSKPVALAEALELL
jgi:EAL domain-containing protein (putative c-di-GMP-specific phosphodiesterase class I)